MRASEFIVEMDRRGFLKGLAGLAASAAVPAPVVKMLSTPAGVSTLTIAAGLALLKGIRAHLDQYTPEDDDDYYDAYEDMTGELGFDSTDAEGNYHDPLSDLLDLYEKNPEQAAQQLIKHIQSKAVDPADVKSSLKPRDDWRYHAKKQQDAALAQAPVQTVATAPGSLARSAAVAQAGVDKLSDKEPVVSIKSKSSLPSPGKSEVEVPVTVKQKQKV